MQDATSCRAVFSGNLFAPRIVEEYGRAIIKKRISAFLLSNQIDLFDFSKVRTVHLFGYGAIARLDRPSFLDLHDDSIEHERVNREPTARLIRARHVWWTGQAGILGLALLVAVLGLVGRRLAYLIRPAITRVI